MVVTVKNIGMIKTAQIKLNGLTVIAGENDTGKSTVGKALFCAIKSSAMSDGKFFYNNRKRYIVVNLFGKLKNIISISSKNYKSYEKLAEKVNNVKEEVERILNSKYSKEKQKELYIRAIEKLKNDPSIKTIPLFDDIFKLMVEAINENFKSKFTSNNFRTVLGFAFANDYFPHGVEHDGLSVEIHDNIKNRKLKFVITGDETKYEGSKIFSEAIYIDSPVIFQLIKLLNDTSLQDKEYMPTIKDLKQKLLDLPKKVDIWESTEIQKIAKMIRDIIGGDVENNGTEIVFNKSSDERPIKIENTATGIKSFGLILLLLKQGYIHNNMVLIFDEPEVHLHPKWQLKMANIIVELVKFGVKIIVNTHSPYMIESLELYSNMNDLDSSYYLTKKYIDGKHMIEVAEFYEVIQDLTPIYETLSAPIDDLEKISMEQFRW